MYSQNEGFLAFIQSGDAEVNWYTCPFYGWMECFELVEFEDLNGRLPLFNKIDGGISF